MPCSRTDAPLAQCAPRLSGESNTGSCRVHTPFSTMASTAQPTEQCVHTVRLTSTCAALGLPWPPRPCRSRRTEAGSRTRRRRRRGPSASETCADPSSGAASRRGGEDADRLRTAASVLRGQQHDPFLLLELVSSAVVIAHVLGLAIAACGIAAAFGCSRVGDRGQRAAAALSRGACAARAEREQEAAALRDRWSGGRRMRRVRRVRMLRCGDVLMRTSRKTTPSYVTSVR